MFYIRRPVRGDVKLTLVYWLRTYGRLLTPAFLDTFDARRLYGYLKGKNSESALQESLRSTRASEEPFDKIVSNIFQSTRE